MEFLKLVLSTPPFSGYSYKDASTVGMAVLSYFLNDCGLSDRNIYRDWALADKNDPTSEFNETISTNVTILEEDKGYIFFTEAASKNHILTDLRVSREQFVYLLDEWREKVYLLKPKEVTVKYENYLFTNEKKK